MHLLETDLRSSKDFFAVALNIYKDDSNWVAPLNIEILNLFDKNKNQLLKKGDFKAWILYDNNLAIGRIIAFYTEVKSKKTRPYTGGIAFFECIDSKQAAKLLFDAAINWLSNNKMQTVDACTVPDENYNHWGVLIDGFTQQGYGMPYNPSYYKHLFENYGFNTYYEQNSYHIDLTKEFPKRHIDFANHVINSGEFSFSHFDFAQANKYVKDIVTIFNDVWSHFHADYVPIDEKEFSSVVSKMKPIINPSFIWFAYNKENYPIGMEICIPDINQAIKPFKGKLTLINKLRLTFRLKKIDRARVFVFGVHPDYHKTGLVSGIFLKMSDSLKKAGIKELEMSWIGDYNPTVNKLYKHLGNSTHAKTHATFRYMIDKSLDFKRFDNTK